MAEREVVYIGLGSNLSDPKEQLRRARRALAALPETELLSSSPLYRTPPMGPRDQPDYLNGVVALKTRLSPLKLLRDLQEIERRQGRVRGPVRWGPRTLDLDLLLYGKRRIELPELTVPHPGIASRPFVLYPLAEIAAPELWIPGAGRLGELLRRHEGAEIEKLSLSW